jgi:hypothetical protein
VCAGFSPDAFWALTPREYAAHMRGAAKRIERERDDLMWLAWHVAALSRTSRFPALEDLRRPAGPKRKMTPEEFEAVRLAWESHLGAMQ